MMRKRVFWVLAFTLVVFASRAYAGLIYSKPELMGQVIDAETKEPIERAVVSVYYKNGLYIDFADKGSVCIHTYETTTDEYGKFRIPAYTTLIWPTRYDNGMGIIIYKPGYSCFPEWTPLGGVSETWFFDPQKFGRKGDRKIHSIDGPVSFTYGIVELKELVKWMHRIRAIPSPSDCDVNDLPLLRDITIKEMDALGL